MGAYFNKKAYTDPALRKEYTNRGFWVNIRLIRYADVLLMGAESANEKGIPGEAIDYLEQVRARARGTNSNILPKVTTTDQGELREAIRHERRVELGLEFDRFYDLVRWGIAKEVLHAAGKTNYQDKNALLPLPQTEIDKSKGSVSTEPRLPIRKFLGAERLFPRCRNYCSSVSNNVLLGAEHSTHQEDFI